MTINANALRFTFQKRFHDFLDEAINGVTSTFSRDEFISWLETRLMDMWGDTSAHCADDIACWLHIAHRTLDFLDLNEEQLNGLTILLTNKRIDYGDKNIVAFGARGIIVRVMDKVHRLINLSARNGESAVGESTLDALLDIVGYCAVAVLFLREEWLDETVEFTPTMATWNKVVAGQEPSGNVLLSDGKHIDVGSFYHSGQWLSGDGAWNAEQFWWAPLPALPEK